MDPGYKPGLVSASLLQGKTKKSTNPFLEQLFSKKPETRTLPKSKEDEKVLPKKSKKKKKSREVNSQTSSSDDGTVTGKKRKKVADDEELEPKIKPKRKKLIEESEPIKVKSKKSKSSNGMINVADSSQNNAQGKKKSQIKKTDDSDSVTPQSSPSPKKAKKRSYSPEQKATNGINDFPYVHESLLQQSPRKKKGKELKVKGKVNDDEETRNNYKRDKTADNRTIFIGNCALSSNKKVITNLFKEYGTIESVRFRCGPVAKLEIPKRAAVIKKEFHENANSFVCYVVFKEEESAKKAVEKNGHVLKGLHLRVDISSNFKKHDKKRSVFVGNLPFTVTEEDLRGHFEDCGEINNVRIVRDRQTSIGKGIAYVQFESKDGVMLAKKLNETEFQGRQLRVKTCTNKPKPEKQTDKHGKSKKPSQASRPPQKDGKRKMIFAPSNRKSSNKSFHEMLQAKKDKRLSKMKKKKAIVQKSDGLSSIFGDMAADMKKLKDQNPRLRDKKVKDKKKIKAKEKKEDRRSQKKER